MPRSLWKRALLGLGVASVSLGAAFAEERALNRSLYVPVRFAPCEHLEQVMLYRGDDPLRELPGTHIFQFTYYPDLSRLEPSFERVRVEGEHQGSAFRSEVVVTPASVYIGKKKIDLDWDEHLARLKQRVDVRYQTVVLSLRCSSACRRLARLESSR